MGIKRILYHIHEVEEKYPSRDLESGLGIKAETTGGEELNHGSSAILRFYLEIIPSSSPVSEHSVSSFFSTDCQFFHVMELL